MLVDTDVLIDYLRSRPEAVRFLEDNVDLISISAVSVAELFQGVREGPERIKFSMMLSALTIRDFRSSSGCGLAECMIAATASFHDLDLVTLNARHFAMLKRVIVPYVKS